MHIIYCVKKKGFNNHDTILFAISPRLCGFVPVWREYLVRQTLNVYFSEHLKSVTLKTESYEVMLDAVN